MKENNINATWKLAAITHFMSRAPDRRKITRKNAIRIMITNRTRRGLFSTQTSQQQVCYQSSFYSLWLIADEL